MKNKRTEASAIKQPAHSALGKMTVALLFAIVIGAFFYFDADQYITLETLKTNRDRLLEYTQEHYPSAVVTFIFFYCLQTTFSLPGAAFFTLAGGFLFGALAGTLYANIGATGGAMFAFLVARYLLRDWVDTKFGHRLEALQDGFARDAFSYLLSLRLVPIFPFFLINLLSGLSRMRLTTFVAATAIGIIPGSFVYAYAGRQLGTINSLGEIASPPVLSAFMLLGLLALAPNFYRTFIVNRRRARP